MRRRCFGLSGKQIMVRLWERVRDENEWENEEDGDNEKEWNNVVCQEHDTFLIILHVQSRVCLSSAYFFAWNKVLMSNTYWLIMWRRKNDDFDDNSDDYHHYGDVNWWLWRLLLMYYLLREVMTLLLELYSQLRTHSLVWKGADLVFCFHLIKTLMNCFSFLNGGCVSWRMN